jgi:hypothetical protein
MILLSAAKVEAHDAAKNRTLNDGKLLALGIFILRRLGVLDEVASRF